MTISKPQKTLLHVVKAKLGWDDDLYRQILVRISGATSSTELDQDGFAAVMGQILWLPPARKGRTALRQPAGHGDLRADRVDPRAVARAARRSGVQRRDVGWLAAQIPEGGQPAVPDAGRGTQDDHRIQGVEGTAALGGMIRAGISCRGGPKGPPLSFSAGLRQITGAGRRGALHAFGHLGT